MARPRCSHETNSSHGQPWHKPLIAASERNHLADCLDHGSGFKQVNLVAAIRYHDMPRSRGHFREVIVRRDTLVICVVSSGEDHQ